MRCPNCQLEAVPAGNNAHGDPMYRCTNDQMACEDMLFTVLSEHIIHIDPACFAQFVKASQERRDSEQ